VMSWPTLKMVSDVLNSLVDAIEHEIGFIPTGGMAVSQEAQRAAVRSLGIVSRGGAPSADEQS
jgi:hypothetical protein